jgi:hypothetical protein
VWFYVAFFLSGWLSCLSFFLVRVRFFKGVSSHDPRLPPNSRILPFTNQISSFTFAFHVASMRKFLRNESSVPIPVHAEEQLCLGNNKALNC